MPAKPTLFILAALGPVITIPAYAEVYMTDEQAAKSIFPGVVFEKKDVTLTDKEKERVENLSDEKVRSGKLNYFKSKDGQIVFVDQVLGKHEFISLAVGIDKGGKVRGIEILEYRESYGQGVMKPEWRAQFTNKDKTAPLKIDKDIKNISGATLSSVHVTNGVRRLLQTYDQVKDRI
jgi:Na+-translocating ferredoxin:NAD+ oxidoreductase RnfG subunit